MTDAVSYKVKGYKLQKPVIKWVYLKVIQLLYGIQQKYLFIFLKGYYNTLSMFHFKDWTKQPLVVPVDLNHSVICVAASQVSSDKMTLWDFVSLE